MGFLVLIIDAIWFVASPHTFALAVVLIVAGLVFFKSLSWRSARKAQYALRL
jgi:hypothetical protein